MIGHEEFGAMNHLNRWFSAALGEDRSRIISIETMPNGYYRVWFYKT